MRRPRRFITSSNLKRSSRSPDRLCDPSIIWITGNSEDLTIPRPTLVHFKEDVERTRAIVAPADPLAQTTEAERLLRSDLFRSAWMFPVGALDVYFCDAYTHIVVATIISKSRHPAMALPAYFNRIEFPVRAILESYARNTNWRWRMAAREMMARENVLKLDRIRELFNGFCRDEHKLYADVMDAWILHPAARKRLFGITAADYLALSSTGKDAAREAARRQMEKEVLRGGLPAVDLLAAARLHTQLRPAPDDPATAGEGRDDHQGDRGRGVPRQPMPRAHHSRVPALPRRQRLPIDHYDRMALTEPEVSAGLVFMANPGVRMRDH